MTGDKNPSRKDSLTPLHLAAGKGHFQVCIFVMENLENKNTGNKRGKTPFHVAAKRGQLTICLSSKVLTIIFQVTSMG